MNDVELAQAIAREVASRGGRTYYVGGYVRDRVLGRPSKDVDIEVHGIAVPELEGLLGQLGSLEAFGASFGIYNLHGHTLDIAVPRRADAAGRGSGDQIASYADPFVGTYQAALRRDFTMNALYEDVLTGEVIDHFGGLADLRQGVIRHVNDVTFAEDPLRVLRAAQFAARFGMRVADETVALCSTLDLSGLPSERVLVELEKALTKAAKPSTFFRELRQMGQLEPWFHEVAALVGVPQNPQWHPEGDVWEHTMRVVDAAAGMRDEAEHPFELVLSALCHDLGKATTTELRDGRIVSYGHETAGVPLARALLSRLGASDRTRSYVLNMVELHMLPNANVAQHAKPKTYNKLFDRSCCPHDLLLLAHADALGCGVGPSGDKAAGELQVRLRDFEDLMARPYVQGRDLLEAGVTPGPELGEALRYAHKVRLSGRDKEEQLRQALGYWRSLQRG